MGRVNFGREIHDRKGVHGPVELATIDGDSHELTDWEIYRLPLDEHMTSNLIWKNIARPGEPAFWRGTFNLDKTGNTFLDLRTWGKGVLWINGHCLARFWNIGPTQTAFVPGAWLKTGRNEVIVLDLLVPQTPILAGLKEPILDQLRPELDFSDTRRSNGKLQLAMKIPALVGKFDDEPKPQEVHLPKPSKGKQFCLEILSNYGDKASVAIAELDLLDPRGQNIPHGQWTIAYVDSEERLKEDGSAMNAIDGQVSDCWRSKRSDTKSNPQTHCLVIDLGSEQDVGGFRYTPSSSAPISRIENYRVFIGNDLVAPRLP
jgi:beta-galactosidase